MTDKEIIARQAAVIFEQVDRIKELESNSIHVQKVYSDFSEIYIRANLKNCCERAAGHGNT